MNLKSKLFGFGAATVLSLSMMSGVAADSATSDVGLTLTETECAVSFTQGANLFYGEWVWNGTEYQKDWQAGSKAMNAKLDSGSPRGCEVTITFGGLTGTNPANVIPYSAFSGSLLTFPSTNLGVIPGLDSGFNLTAHTGVLHTNQYPGSLSLTDDNDVINGLNGDEYSGQIEVEVSNAP